MFVDDPQNLVCYHFSFSEQCSSWAFFYCLEPELSKSKLQLKTWSTRHAPVYAHLVGSSPLIHLSNSWSLKLMSLTCHTAVSSNFFSKKPRNQSLSPSLSLFLSFILMSGLPHLLLPYCPCLEFGFYWFLTGCTWASHRSPTHLSSAPSILYTITTITFLSFFFLLKHLGKISIM